MIDRMEIITSAAPPWMLAPAMTTLASNEVHVWRACLDVPPATLDSLLPTLSTDERTRAERFHFQSDREKFIAAHGILRAILGRYVNRAPECLSFYHGTHGKPSLTREFGGNTIRFNLSHSHGVALYAIARRREVGVDLEFVRPDLEFEQIAERFFSRRERTTLRALPTEMHQFAFFLCWTRKEAYIKAKGEGLSLPLAQFDVSLTPGQPAALLNTRPDSDEARRWSLHELNLASGYVAALAVEGNRGAVCRWQWPQTWESSSRPGGKR
jgi:4'-phosphopantetheinyl transferase